MCTWHEMASLLARRLDDDFRPIHIQSTLFDYSACAFFLLLDKDPSVRVCPSDCLSIHFYVSNDLHLDS